MFFAWRLAALLAFGLCTALVGRLDAQPADGPNAPNRHRREQLQQWIEQLDTDSYEARETATRQLIAAGEEAQPLAETAIGHKSPEVRFRAAAILQALQQKPLRELEQEVIGFASQKEEQLDVERGMCLVSRILDPHVREPELVKKLDELAEKVRRRLGKEIDPAQADPQMAVAALKHVLFEDCGFRGNQDDYNNPNNCSLGFVLATGKGKPVLLGQLLVAVARRLKIPLVGVPVTGQYLVKYDGSRAPAGYSRDDIYLHPFQNGKILSRADRAREYPDYDPDRMVPAATNRETLSRILRNIVEDLDERDDAVAPHKRRLTETMLELLSSQIVSP